MTRREVANKGIAPSVANIKNFILMNAYNILINKIIRTLKPSFKVAVVLEGSCIVGSSGYCGLRQIIKHIEGRGAGLCAANGVA